MIVYLLDHVQVNMTSQYASTFMEDLLPNELAGRLPPGTYASIFENTMLFSDNYLLPTTY